MNVRLRRVLVLAALFAIAGCAGGTTSQSPSLPLQGASAFVHRGVPFAAPMRFGGFAPFGPLCLFDERIAGFRRRPGRSVGQRFIRPPISPVIPRRLRSFHAAAGCPYGLAVDKKATIYVADNCGGNDVEEYPEGLDDAKNDDH